VTFPALAVIGTSERVEMLVHAAQLLGISVTAFESREALTSSTALFDQVIFADDHTVEINQAPDQRIPSYVIAVARSPHGQAATWPITEADFNEATLIQTVTPAPEINADQAALLQRHALNEAASRELVGVMCVQVQIIESQVTTTRVSIGPTPANYWTLVGSQTSIFEQHIRALFNLPLGSTRALFPVVVMRRAFAGEKPDMFYPYLHLFARDPELKVHQYRVEPIPGAVVGHLTLGGEHAEDLLERLEHAALYFSGEIEE
jgi:5-(carboxyamino)imidazole ribonucleotide synthase